MKVGVDWRKWATFQVFSQRSIGEREVGWAMQSKRCEVLCGWMLQSGQMSLGELPILAW